MNLLPYRPHPLLRSGHLQTLMVGMTCGVRPEYRARPFPVQLSDGEALVVHEEASPTLGIQAPLVILIHGLGGDHRSPYLERLAPRLRDAGMLVWRVDLRGCGKGLHLAWRPANAGRSNDLAAVIRAASKAHPDRRIHVVGFSLSGNILLKMLGEAAVGALESPLDLQRIGCAIAIAPPVDLHSCANNMDRFSRKVYTHYYLKVLKAQVQLRRQQWPQWNAIPTDPKIRTIRQFDDRYTAPLSGFTGSDQYYALSSADKWMRHISTPTTILVDRDDPIVTASLFDQTHLGEASIQMQFTRHGGHMGYFAIDASGRTMRWMEYFVAQTLKNHINASF